MPTVERSYPFAPTAVSDLESGQFWAIPLDAGGYACGIVMDVKSVDHRTGKRVPRAFEAGLLDWCGAGPPQLEDPRDVRTLLDHGLASLLVVTEAGDLIRGRRSLDEWPLEVPYTVTDKGIAAWLMQGGRALRPATSEEIRTLDVHASLGYTALNYYANFVFKDDPRLTGGRE